MMNTNKTQICFSQGHQSTQRGAIIGSNDDLLTEILLRLPVASILRFKSVSKHWRLLLSHTHFTQRYDKVSKTPGLFVRDTYIPYDVENPTTPPFRSLDSYFDRPRVIIVQSCNGLLLCCTDRGPKGGKAAPKYYVFNPTTKQLATIPPILGGRKVHKTIRFMGLAFHQTDCVHYKLVCIRSLESDTELFQIQIYSSDTGKWKISIESFYALNPVFCKGVYWNGALYWAPSYGNHLYFNIDAQQLQTLPLPAETLPSQTRTMYFGESRGHLHLIVSNDLNASKNHEDSSLRLNVYEMLSDHSGWFVKYRIELDGLLGAFPELINMMNYRLYVVDVVRGVREEDTFLALLLFGMTSDFHYNPAKLITYNVHAKSLKYISTLSHNTFFFVGRLEYFRYIETLFSFQKTV